MENTEGLLLKAGSSIICWNMFNDAHTNRALITSLIKGYLAGIKLWDLLTQIRFSLREVPVNPLGTVSQHFLHFCITSQWVHMKTLRFVLRRSAPHRVCVFSQQVHSHFSDCTMLSLITRVFSLSDDFIDSWFDYCNLWTAHGFSLEIVIIPSTFNMFFLVLLIPGNCLVIAVWRFCGENNLNKANQMLAGRSKVSQRGLHWGLLSFKHWLTVILFNQSWTGKRSKGLSEPSFLLGEEADQLLSGETADGNDLQETGINPAVVCSYLTTEPWLKPIFNPLWLFVFLFFLLLYFISTDCLFLNILHQYMEQHWF